MPKKLVSVVTPCYNEEDNVEEVYRRVKAVFDASTDYRYEHIFIDNASRDKTRIILKRLAETDKNVKVILNTRNFGHIRSPYYGMLQARGDAVISVVADLQDPPEMIPDFLRAWESGYKIVLAQKTKSEESRLFFFIRGTYYYIARKLADIDLLDNVTGFGLYDRAVVDVLRRIDDPYPYFRGLICDVGFPRYMIPFTQPTRKRGLTKNNLYTLYDLAMLGITNHSKIPLRLATFAGFCIGALSLLTAVLYFAYKLVFWNNFQVGIAPLVIGIFFFGAVQLFFTGILGEYIGAIHTQVLKRPLVIESERINFED
ncbi:MAG: glycosyltransferase family 2 protein [Planctomycetota bacterium]